jgi:type II secretory pathway component PulF
MDVHLSRVWQQLQLKLNQLSFDTKAQQAFLEDMASLIEDGVPLKQVLESFVAIHQGAPRQLAESMLSQLSQGYPIAEGMVGWYAPEIIEIIRAGEEGGILAQVLRTTAASLTQRESALNSVLNSMTYPLVVICGALAVSVFINHSIFSSFRSITPVREWPVGAQILTGIANFVQDWWWMLLATVFILIFLFIRFLKDYIGDLRPTLDNLPIWNIYRKLNAGRFMETLGLLIANGLVLKKALKILQNKASTYLASHLMVMERRLGAGQDNIADVLDTGLISAGDLSRLKLIAKSKGFEHALVRQGQRAQDEGTQSIKTSTKIFSGFLLALAAAFMIFMIVSVYSVGFSIVPSY